MSKTGLQSSMADIAARGTVAAEDVLALRRSLFGDGVITGTEAGWLIDLDEAVADPVQAWSDFFCEALVDYVVRQQSPSGYVSEENAAWLVSAIGRDGVVRTATELELLVKVLETATSSPVSLSAFALRQVAVAVIDGEGPLSRGGQLRKGVIGRDEVDLLRRILYAFGGDQAIGVSRQEVEVLFDLNDRTAETENDPSWSDLFVKAVVNFLMATRGYVVPARDEALRREAWLDAPTPGVSGLFGAMLGDVLASGLRNVWSVMKAEETQTGLRTAEYEREIRAAEIVTSEEVRWLAERIGRDGVIHENERALLRFLADESPDLHPSLRTLLDTAA